MGSWILDIDGNWTADVFAKVDTTLKPNEFIANASAKNFMILELQLIAESMKEHRPTCM